MSNTHEAIDPTRSRVLEAAGEEFAEKGFEAATIRSICLRADANISAVNYHFRDKQQLYTQAVIEAHRCNHAPLPDDAFVGVAPPEQLRLFIHHFLKNVLAVSREDSWHTVLMFRELLRPTEACEALVRQAIRPQFDRLREVLKGICPEIDERRLNALAFSVIGQCLHYKMARPVSLRLIGPEALASLDVEYLTHHITTLCLAALGLVPPLDRAGESAAVEAVSQGGS